MESRLDALFGTRDGIDRNQQIALSTAIAMHRYHRDLYKLLSGPMAAALSIGEGMVTGWGQDTKPPERIGHWVIDGIIRGEVSFDDPLRLTFYRVTQPEVRGHAIGHMAWSFMHAPAVDDVIRDRLADLWDDRVEHVRQHPEDVAEIKDFYWFIRSEKFAASWWLPRLVEALKLDGELDTHGMIGEQLAAAASTFPRETLDALRLLLKPEERPDFEGYDLRRYALAPVIAAGLDSGDPELIQDARALMNSMGARGEIDLERRVQAIRDGAGGE